VSFVRLVCLANSWKESGRCIAGIELETGSWVRPVSNRPHGVVPAAWTMVDGRAIGMLDIVEIPLNKTGPDFGFERENRLIESGTWRVVGKLSPADIEKYCESDRPFLHNNYKYVGKGFIGGLPFEERQTLQLVKVDEVCIRHKTRTGGNAKWELSFAMPNGQVRWLGVTDPFFCQKLEQGHCPSGPLLLTLSLSLPYTPPDWGEPPDPCWKLVAGVIEL
jgi:hypothetical protein